MQEYHPLRRGQKVGIGRGVLRSCGSDLLSQRGERRQRRARGTSSERTSLAPFPQNRDTAKTPYRSVAPPLQIETYRFDLRRTFRRNLPAATNRSCAVFRRIRTRNPSPSAREPQPPCDPTEFTGGTGDEGRRVWTGDTDCHSPLRGFAMTRDGGRETQRGLSVGLTGRPQI